MTDNSHETFMTLHEHQHPQLGQVLFTAEAEPGVNPQSYYLTQEAWESIGSPEAITVTAIPAEIPEPEVADGAEILPPDES